MRVGIVASLGLLTALSYARVRSFGLVYDDPHWLWPLNVGVGPHAWAMTPFLFADWLGGGLPWAFHGLVLSLHLLNGVLLWSLLRSWRTEARALVLMLFWLHPIQVESVAYITGGMEVLLTSYVLLAWVLSRGSMCGRALALVCLGLGASLKYSALPILIVVPLAWAVQRKVSIWPRLLPLGIVAFILGQSPLSSYLAAVPWSVRLSQASTLALALLRYVAFLVWPVGFSIEHDWTQPALVGWLALAAVFAVGIAAWSARQRWIAPWYAWLWIVALIGPRVLATNAPPLTEHHTNLPFLALWLLAGSAWARFTAQESYA